MKCSSMFPWPPPKAAIQGLSVAGHWQARPQKPPTIDRATPARMIPKSNEPIASISRAQQGYSRSSQQWRLSFRTSGGSLPRTRQWWLQRLLDGAGFRITYLQPSVFHVSLVDINRTFPFRYHFLTFCRLTVIVLRLKTALMKSSVALSRSVLLRSRGAHAVK
jgi:hypothetical protein